MLRGTSGLMEENTRMSLCRTCRPAPRWRCPEPTKLGGMLRATSRNDPLDRNRSGISSWMKIRQGRGFRGPCFVSAGVALLRL